MGTGLILVVEPDDWVARLLDSSLRGAGYEVSVVGEALAGLRQFAHSRPECVICATKLPDFDGAWVVGQIRASASRLSDTPVLLLATPEMDEAVDAGFRAGADAVVAKPFRVREVILQVNALVEMAARLRRPTEREAPPLLTLRPSLFPTEALRSSLAQMSLAMVLALLEMERRSGRLRISREGGDASIELASGFATTAAIEGKPTPLVQALRQLLAWRTGVVSFVVGRKLPPPPGAQPIAALLMQAMQAPPPPTQPPRRPTTLAPPPPIPKPPRLPTMQGSPSAVSQPPRSPATQLSPDAARPRHRPPHRSARGMLTPPPPAPPRMQPK
jgi:two-component system OmpR family response regulator